MACDPIFLRDVIRPVVPEAVNFHPESVGALGDFLPDAAKTDEPDAFPEDFVAGEPCPFSCLGGINGGDEVFRDGEQQQHGVLGDGVVVDAGGEEDGNLHLLGRGEVDLVETYAVFGNDFEVRRAFLKDSASDCIVTAQKSIELQFREFEHACLGKWATLFHNVPTLGLHEFVMRAGGVLVGAGGEEDFHKL